MQAQVPHNPYTGLWSRLAGFRPESCPSCWSAERSCGSASCAGRSTSSPATTVCCCGRWCSPSSRLSCAATGSTRRRFGTSTWSRWSSSRAALLAEKPRSGTELRAIFAERFPDLDPAALAHACQMQLAFVQVPPRGLWGRSAQVRSTTAESWLGRPFVRRSVDRRGRAALPRGLRPGLGRRRDDVVPSDRNARGRRAAAAAARHLPGRARPRALRPASRAATLGGDARAGALPARVRQRPALARRPQPLHSAADRAALGPGWTIGWGSVLYDGSSAAGGGWNRTVWSCATSIGCRSAHSLQSRRRAGGSRGSSRRKQPDVRLRPLSP